MSRHPGQFKFSLVSSRTGIGMGISRRTVITAEKDKNEKKEKNRFCHDYSLCKIE